MIYFLGTLGHSIFNLITLWVRRMAWVEGGLVIPDLKVLDAKSTFLLNDSLNE